MNVNEITDLLKDLIRKVMIEDHCTFEDAFRKVEIELEYIKQTEL